MSCLLSAICIALGHIRDRRAIGPLVRLRKHPHEDVRYGAVFGLLTYGDKRAISALIELFEDVDEHVRDWATFGLESQIDKDSAEIREALAKRLHDEHLDTRGEAIVGLARRDNERALAPLVAKLAGESRNVGSLVLEAAAELKDARLCPYLLALRKEWEGDDDSHTKLLAEAIRECRCDDDAT